MLANLTCVVGHLHCLCFQYVKDSFWGIRMRRCVPLFICYMPRPALCFRITLQRYDISPAPPNFSTSIGPIFSTNSRDFKQRTKWRGGKVAVAQLCNPKHRPYLIDLGLLLFIIIELFSKSKVAYFRHQIPATCNFDTASGVLLGEHLYSWAFHTLSWKWLKRGLKQNNSILFYY